MNTSFKSSPNDQVNSNLTIVAHNSFPDTSDISIWPIAYLPNIGYDSSTLVHVRWTSFRIDTRVLALVVMPLHFVSLGPSEYRPSDWANVSTDLIKRGVCLLKCILLEGLSKLAHCDAAGTLCFYLCKKKVDVCDSRILQQLAILGHFDKRLTVHVRGTSCEPKEDLFKSVDRWSWMLDLHLFLSFYLFLFLDITLSKASNRMDRVHCRGTTMCVDTRIQSLIIMQSHIINLCPF